MAIFFVLCLLFGLRGYFCQVTSESDISGNGSMQYLTVKGPMFCIHDSQYKDPFNCKLKLLENDYLFDYDFNEGILYYFVSINFLYKSKFTSDSARKVHCQGKDTDMSCGLEPDIFSRRDYEYVKDITLDWIHNTLYITYYNGRYISQEQLFASENNSTTDTLIIDPYIEPEYLAKPAGIVGGMLKFIDLQVDPYNKLLFIQMSISAYSSIATNADNLTTVIIRSDLMAKKPRLLRNKRFSKDMKYYVDISEQRIHVLDNQTIYTYNYNGREIMKPLPDYPFSPEYTEKFVIFRNIAYSFNSSETHSYIGQVSLADVAAHSGKNVSLELIGVKRSFMLYDVRSKRQMINGDYVCDRKDCPDLCNVLPSGEVCVCRESRSMTRDGLTCYDCGQSSLTSVKSEAMISGGHKASLRNFPWHSVIYQLIEGDWEQTCGGTLISSSVVLTAAHCVINLDNVREQEIIDPEKFTVVLGKIYRDWNAYETMTEVWLKVKEIIPHSDFMGTVVNYANDIALLTLDSKINFTRFVMPACIDFNHNQLPSYKTLVAYVPGFGFTADCGIMCSTQSTDLLYTTSTVISYTECIKGALNISSDTFLSLPQDKFCIGNGSESPVQKGDSGGGLTLAYHGLHYVTGVVSVKFMKRDGDSSVYSYGAFTNLSHHMDWLKQNMPEEH